MFPEAPSGCTQEGLNHCNPRGVWVPAFLAWIMEEFRTTEELLSTVWALTCGLCGEVAKPQWPHCISDPVPFDLVALLFITSTSYGVSPVSARKANPVQAASPWFLLSWFNMRHGQRLGGGTKLELGQFCPFQWCPGSSLCCLCLPWKACVLSACAL